MIRWLVVFFAALPALLAEAWFTVHVWPVPAVTVGFCLFLALFARPAAVPGLLLCAALARSVLLAGDAALHLLALGLPVAVLVPLRALVFGSHPLVQGGAAAFLAVTVPGATAMLARFATEGPAVPAAGWQQIAGALVAGPLVASCLRVLPPGSRFVEPSP